MRRKGLRSEAQRNVIHSHLRNTDKNSIRRYDILTIFASFFRSQEIANVVAYLNIGHFRFL
jgi:hypothetical protein